MSISSELPPVLTYHFLKKRRPLARSLLLSKYRSIEDRAAVVLPLMLGTRWQAKDIFAEKLARVFPLYLGGLVELSEEAATGLARHAGFLQLTGLTHLGDMVAYALSRHRGTLHLGGITHLTEIEAIYLSKHRGPFEREELFYRIWLMIAGIHTEDSGSIPLIRHTSPEWIRQQCEQRFGPFDAMQPRKVIEPKSGGYLGLGGVRCLPDDSLAHFANHVGHLSLSGLSELTETGAQFLSRHTGDLHLHGLKALSDSQAEAFTKLKGTLHLRRDIRLSSRAASLLEKVRRPRLP